MLLERNCISGNLLKYQMDTNDEKEELLRSYFNERLMPVKEMMLERGVEFFPTSPDSSAETYYVDRTDDGNYVHEIGQDITAELSSVLEHIALPELSSLTESLITLAETLQEQEETREEVSPFVYAMF